jgi:hypothetical protein
MPYITFRKVINGFIIYKRQHRLNKPKKLYMAMATFRGQSEPNTTANKDINIRGNKSSKGSNSNGKKPYLCGYNHQFKNC